jgi:hypothetical protein
MLNRSILLAAALLAVSAWSASARPARPTAPAAPPSVAQFDGNWSVSVITDNGTCDRGYRYALHIQNGRIFYDNPNFNVSGSVDARGNVRVSVGAGSQQAVGTGRMSRDYGTGSWTGRSAMDQCSGHWDAERRNGQTSSN